MLTVLTDHIIRMLTCTLISNRVTLFAIGRQASETLHMRRMLTLQLRILFGLQLYFLLFVLVDHAMDTHAFFAVRALAGAETH